MIKEIGFSVALFAASAVPIFADTDWSGLYVGGSYATASGDMIDIGGPWALNEDASLASVFGGYRHDMGSIVLGGEISKSLVMDAYQASWPAWGFSSLTDIRATVGYDIGNVLVYALAGLTMSDFSTDADEYEYDGWNAGVGVDVMVGESAFVGAQYVRRDLERVDNTNWSTNFDTFEIRFGLSF